VFFATQRVFNQQLLSASKLYESFSIFNEETVTSYEALIYEANNQRACPLFCQLL